MIVDPFSFVISVLSLSVSAGTAWLTLFRRGTVRMTQPTVIFFGPDTPRSPHKIAMPKIYLRTLLFSTSKRGRVIESMHVSISRNETNQNFNVWVFGERGKLVRGSGLFVGENGIAADHHFLAPSDGNAFSFIEGQYRINVFAHLLGDKKPKKLFSQTLDISRDIAADLEEKNAGLYFDWGPDSSRYIQHVEKRPSVADRNEFIELLEEFTPSK